MTTQGAEEKTTVAEEEAQAEVEQPEVEEVAKPTFEESFVGIVSSFSDARRSIKNTASDLVAADESIELAKGQLATAEEAKAGVVSSSVEAKTNANSMVDKLIDLLRTWKNENV